MVTRSGSNEFHGNLFEFLRNSGFGSAREFFSTTTSPYIRNQYGGTVGGPIKKNKMFFFGGFQGTTLRYNPNNTISTVPTQAMLQGNWSNVRFRRMPRRRGQDFEGAFRQRPDLALGIQSAPAVYIADKTLASLSARASLRTSAAGSRMILPTMKTTCNASAKIDYQLNDKQSLFFRLLDTHNKILNSFSVTPNLLTAASTGLDQLGNPTPLAIPTSISSNLVQSFRAGYQRTASNNIQNQSYSFCQAGRSELLVRRESE